jgi:hypothetical protein
MAREIDSGQWPKTFWKILRKTPNFSASFSGSKGNSAGVDYKAS